MKKLVVSCFIICAAILFACNNDGSANASKYLNPNNLAVQSFTINTLVDNNIVTKQGIKISIAKGSIEAASQNVTLEIKEALSLDAMLKAGLTTQTKDGILSSEGMFYIATKEASTIKKPIAISVPTAFADTSMQFYKGKDNSGKIEWEAPTPLTTKASEKPNGRDIFKNNCASCHAIGKRLTGPDLAWIENRWPNRSLLYAYIRNNQAFLNGIPSDTLNSLREFASTESVLKAQKYACCVYNTYVKSAMNLFPNLTNIEIDGLVDYINSESIKLGISRTFNPSSECDSCDYYNNLYASLNEKRGKLISQNEMQVLVKGVVSGDTVPVIAIPTKVDPPSYNAEYYTFNINAYGWYNVDALLVSNLNSMKSELSVSINGEGVKRAQVYLIIPSVKVFAAGGLLNDGKVGFYDQDGSIYLPQNIDAIIIALSEKDGKTYYGQASFLTSLKNDISLTMKETDSATILKSMEAFKLDKVTMTIDKTKNYDSIKKVDSLLPIIHKKLENCNCNYVKDEPIIGYESSVPTI